MWRSRASSCRRKRGADVKRLSRFLWYQRTSQFDRRDRSLSCDGRKVVEKFLKRVPAVQVVEQSLKRNPRAAKNRSAAGDVRIRRYDVGVLHIWRFAFPRLSRF